MQEQHLDVEVARYKKASTTKADRRDTLLEIPGKYLLNFVAITK